MRGRWGGVTAGQTAGDARSLSYACGGMHGEDEVSCERYYCEGHLAHFIAPDSTGRIVRICASCAAAAVESGLFKDDDDVLVRTECTGKPRNSARRG